MKITKADIRRLVPDHIYQRGLRYYQFGRVDLLEIEPDHFQALVSGSDDYTVEVSEEPGGWIYADCDCPYWSDCKHIVAAMIAAKDYYESADLNNKNVFTSGWKYYLDQVDRAHSSKTTTKPKWQLVYTLETRPTEFIVHPQKVTIRKDGSLGALRNLGYGDYSDPQLLRSRNDNLVLSFLEKSQNSRPAYYYYEYSRPGPFHFKYGDSVGVLFDLLVDSQICFRKGTYPGTQIRFAEQKLGVEFRLVDTGERSQLQAYLKSEELERALTPDYRVLTSEPVWLLETDCLFRVEGLNQAAYLIPFARKQYDVSIPKEEVPQFFSAITNQVDLFDNFRLPEGARTETVTEISEKRIYLEEIEEGILVKLRFLYGTMEIDPDNARPSLWGAVPEDNVFQKAVRNEAQEGEARQELLNTSVKLKRDGTITSRKNKSLTWLMEEVPQLISSGFVIFGETDLNRFKVNRSTAQVRVAVESGIDWFDLKMEIDFGGILLSLKELRKALRQRSQYVKLADGSTAKLPAAWVNRFRHVVNLSDSEEERLKLSHFHVTLIDELFAEASQKDFDRTYHQKLQQLRKFTGITKRPQPKTLQGTLRPYQLAGLNWLHFLEKFSFGGCLADDMGLGKTVQALALLLSSRRNGKQAPALIVTPTSVVFNWLNEIESFAPSLRVLNLTGQNRPRTMKNYEGYDVVLTSYGTLRRDILFLKDVSFHYVILDESQYIKNPISQTAKAAKLLKADHRLALTGTPVENNTIELWSLFSFLNPGLLGNLNYFKGHFAKPIEQNQDAESAELLRKVVFPFVLRRSKDDVEKDLPPKVENVVYCEMPAAQEKLYNRWRDYYRAALLKQIGEVGINKSRMNVLSGLTKLRELACHPLLIEKKFRGKVGKFETLIEYFDELLAEGHKMLVFSQFVKMLTIVRKHLDASGIPYEYLEGKTRDRKSCVERFQSDEECKIFLISLRAGGTGLNLTAADYVIHYDPWWNPAVEMQATDRTHRIGQDKHVFVYKMISKGTVEEKILQLQERKKKLVSNIITTDTAFFKHLTVDDIEVLFS